MKASNESIVREFRNLLADRGVSELQFDVLQPASGFQAVLLTAIRGNAVDLNSQKSQLNIRELRSLIELGLLTDLRETQKDLDTQFEPEVDFRKFK